jgi:ABC-2 type transport system ATP-binding protein
MDNSEPVIEANDLRHNYDDVQTMLGVSFSVKRGEIFGLLGSNGAGKTTTIRLLTGRIDPNGRSARVAGCDVVNDRPKLKGLIEVVFQEQNLCDWLTVYNNLRFNCWRTTYRSVAST